MFKRYKSEIKHFSDPISDYNIIINNNDEFEINGKKLKIYLIQSLIFTCLMILN